MELPFYIGSRPGPQFLELASGFTRFLHQPSYMEMPTLVFFLSDRALVFCLFVFFFFTFKFHKEL